MQVLGKIWKDGKFWVIDCPTIDASTQGFTKKEALSMMVDLVQTMVNDPDCEIEISSVGNVFSMSFKNVVPILSLMVKRLRKKSKRTLLETAKEMGIKNHNSVYQYETGKHAPGFEKLDQLLSAMGYELVVSIKAEKRKVG